MDRRRFSRAGSWVLIAVIVVLWAWKPQHPAALRIGVDVIGVAIGIGWLLIIADWLLSTAGWLAWVRGGGLRSLASNLTLRSSAPLLTALAGLGALAFLIYRVT